MADEFVSEEWQYQLTPYAWALALDGDVTVKGQKSEVDVDFNEIFDDLNYGAMIEGEVRKGRLGVMAQGLYADLGTSSDVAVFEIDTDITVLWASLGAYYRLGPWPLDGNGGALGPVLIVDPYVGLRYTYLDVELDITGGRGRTVDADEEWVEPIVGFRSIWQFTPSWSLSTITDIGGFGVGSDFAWQATGLIGYQFGLFGDADARALVGYKALHQDYDTGSGANEFEWDMTLHGPIFALAIQF